jgi:hypothetical protein
MAKALSRAIVSLLEWFVVGDPISIALAIAAWQAQTTAE